MHLKIEHKDAGKPTDVILTLQEDQLNEISIKDMPIR